MSFYQLLYILSDLNTHISSRPIYNRYVNQNSSIKYIGKRASLFTLRKGRKASVTLEAAVIISLFLAACMSILFFTELFRVETKVSQALFNTARYISQYIGPFEISEDESGIIGAGINIAGIYTASEMVKNEAGADYMDSPVLSSGKKSFSFVQSEITGEYVDLVVSYKVRFPVPFIKVPAISIVQRCKMHTWAGELKKDGKNNGEDTVVYVTETGSVYHKDRNCSYIKLSIYGIVFEELPDKRNDGGAKYYACERCVESGKKYSTVYITSDGTRYHCSLSCSGLKRIVKQIKLSEVINTHRACSRCG